MRSVFFLLLGVIASAHAKDSIDLSTNSSMFVDKLADKLTDRAKEAWPIQSAVLESATLGKPGHLLVSSSPGVTSISRGVPTTYISRGVPNIPSIDRSVFRNQRMKAAEKEEAATAEPAKTTEESNPDISVPVDVRADSEKKLPGGSVNLFDPAAYLSRFLTRRFGIVGGLGLVGALALVEGNEFFTAFREDFTTRDLKESEIEEKTLPNSNGLTYRDTRVGGGALIENDNFVGVQLVIKNGNEVVVDTKKGDSKPVAFVYGKPAPGYPGLEEGVKGMRRGGIRILSFPPSKDGTKIEYTIEVVEVSQNYLAGVTR